MPTDEEGHNYFFTVPDMPWRAYNDFFHKSDPHTQYFMGWPLPDGWWSRHYEYPWAIQFAKPHHVVADMGCGYTFRPFKNVLASICKLVYAVDIDDRLFEQECPDTMIRVIGDFTKKTSLETESIDTLFCISVLEDLSEKLPKALAEFKRLLKPDGLMVLTFDTPYDITKPCPHYPGLEIADFISALDEAGLDFHGPINMDGDDVIFHEEYNLTVYHGVLRKAE